MQHARFCLVAPLALWLGAAPALAQQTAPPPSAGAARPNETRDLESQIEEYPGPTDGMKDEAETRIPEAIHPAPNPPRVAPAGGRAPDAPRVAGDGATPEGRAPSSVGSPIDRSEVQRVFGHDTGLVDLASLEPSRITRLQLRLRELGHYLGALDGIAGPRTRAALESFARAQFALKQRLLQRGQLTTDLIQQLGVDAGARDAAVPPPRDDLGPSMRRSAPLLPPGGAPLPPPGMAPLPTPSSTALPPRGGATPDPGPPSP